MELWDWLPAWLLGCLVAWLPLVGGLVGGCHVQAAREGFEVLATDFRPTPLALLRAAAKRQARNAPRRWACGGGAKPPGKTRPPHLLQKAPGEMRVTFGEELLFLLERFLVLTNKNAHHEACSGSPPKPCDSDHR